MVYQIKNGLRYVRPYYHNYEANAKLRWHGRTIFDVYTSEFRNQPPDHHRLKILNGNFKLVKNPNSKKYHQDFKGACLLHDVVISRGDKIFHKEHIHEPPVPQPQNSVSIPIVYNDDHYLVVDKPPGIPTHPVKSYFYNSVKEMLKRDLKINELYPVHRLDKVTSGILMFGKTPQATSLFKHLIKNKHANKIYVARVTGEFPTTPDLKVDQQVVYIYSARLEVHTYPSISIFNRIEYDPITDESIIECRPVTGTPHQLRIHLRNLGYPIVNDPLYSKGKLYSRIIKNKNDLTDVEWDLYLNGLHKRSLRIRNGRESDNEYRCNECNAKLFKDPIPEEMGICLHSRSYELVDGQRKWKFESSIPDWCSI